MREEAFAAAGKMELSHATGFGKGDGWKRNEGREEGRGAHTTALLADALGVLQHRGMALPKN